MTAPDPTTAAPETAPAPEAPAPEATPTTEPAPQVTDVPEFKAITSQEEFDKIFGSRFAKEKAKYADYDELKAHADKYRESEEAKKDELTKANERIAAFEKAEAERAEENLRNEVATAAGIPAAWAKRLRGSTKEELEADAADLAETIKPPAKPPTSQPQPQGGGTPPKEDTAGFDPAAIAAKLSGKY